MAPEGVRWQLTEYFPALDSDEYRRYRDGLEVALRVLTDAAAHLAPLSETTMRPWANLVLEAERLMVDLGHLSSYISCITAEDAKNEAARAEEARFSRIAAAWEKAQVPFKAMLRTADDPTFERFAAQESIATARFALERMRQEARFTMPAEMENLAADLGVDGLDAWDRLWNTVAGNMEFDLEVPGAEPKRVPFAQKMMLLTDADAAVRKAALDGSNAAWEAVGETAAACLNGLSGARLTLNRYRGVADVLDVAAFQGAVDRRTIDAMWQAVAETRDVPRRYLRLKAKAIGRERLGFQDLVAPMPKKGDAPKLAWDDAVAKMLAAFDARYPALAEFSRETLAKGRIESERRAAKRSGAFCTTSQRIEASRVFMTWGGSFDSLSTLAHELGHAWHSRAMAGLRPLVRSYPMTLAETASTFAEDILKRAILSDPAVDAATRAEMLDAQLCDGAVFLLNIHMRYIFEKAFYAERLAGEVPLARLKELMLDAQRECFGDALAPDEMDPWFWASKLHFYIAGISFYNYPYTFGYLLSRGLGLRLREEGPSFLPRYEEFLRLTGGATAEECARRTLGIDLSGTEFWRSAIGSLNEELAAFENVVG